LSQLAADLHSVRRVRVYFYHHSVGANVLAGLERLDAATEGGRVRLATVLEAIALTGPVLAHGGGGRNGDPRGKIAAFAGALRGEARLNPDLAFMKFCYVDFDPRTDVEGLFAYYRATLDDLQRDIPGIRFGHVTAPLVRRPADFKSSLRRAMGLQVWEDSANANRGEFNRKLRESFPPHLVFDLAAVEAAGPDGRPTTFELAGRRHASLCPAYTDDGGHLNAAGQSAVGCAAIRFLAGALEVRRATS
jgi:hypothetical protein